YDEGSYEEESESEYSEGETDEYGNVIDSSESSEPVESSGGSSSGQAVADFALQFVGNPYVWGGTSLTNGADCSGFVQSVYANFGYSLSRTSESQMYEGRSVSYSEAQPGDLICYGSHVAIYLGNGQIVHASNSAPYPAGGIKVSDNAAYRTILSVRRIVD
ncbi:MAG: C40 family peptidase, partial [Eubacteriales bacterium]|nr:C40 family peptidase [Eubacteriales bacterium]